MALYSHFSTRIQSDAKFKVLPAGPGNPPSSPFYAASVNQVLVGGGNAAVDKIRIAIKAAYPDYVLLARLLDGLPGNTANIDDVFIFELRPTPPDIFQAVDGFRAATGCTRQVSVNHILVPAAFGDHNCPSGPPTPGPPVAIGKSKSGFVPVGVLDAGFQPESMIAGMVATEAAERLPSIQEAKRTGPGWREGNPEILCSPGPMTPFLGALEGHPNFIAGVIQRYCQHANITIRNNNSTFSGLYEYDVPSEATVARSLCYMNDQNVVDVGYAFAAYDNTVSVVWDAAVRYLRANAPPGKRMETMLVCPAGNQGDTFPRYPAALQTVAPLDPKDVGLFDYVVGVGSIDEPSAAGAQVDISDFSNWGDWVTCYANGHDVLSSFFEYDGDLEDDEPGPAGRPTRNFRNGTAVWKGTSFAAPKIVAAIADEIALGTKSPYAAWLKVGGALAQGQNLGVPGYNPPTATKGDCLLRWWD